MEALGDYSKWGTPYVHLDLFTYIVQTNLLEHSSPLRLPKCGGWGPKLAKIEVCKPFQFSCSITNPFSCSIKCKPFQFNSVVRLNANPVDERTIWKLILSISGACWPNGGFISTKPPLSPRTDLVHPHPPFWGHVVAGGPN